MGSLIASKTHSALRLGVSPLTTSVTGYTALSGVAEPLTVRAVLAVCRDVVVFPQAVLALEASVDNLVVSTRLPLVLPARSSDLCCPLLARSGCRISRLPSSIPLSPLLWEWASWRVSRGSPISLITFSSTLAPASIAFISIPAGVGGWVS